LGGIGRWLLVMGACLALLLPGTAFAQRVALVIGNGAYIGSAARLANPPADARAMAAALGRLGFSVTLLIDGDRARMEQELRSFGRRSEGAEIALLFYAGHGIQHGGDNWLLPVNARLQDARDVEFELIGLNSVLRQMERAQTRIVILDACRDNPLAAQLRGAGGTRSVQRGLARMERDDTGTLIAFSTAPGSVAADGTGRNSPFTEALLRHIETPGLDFQLMLRQVRRSVLQATGGAQVPWENGSLVHEVVLKPAVVAPGATPAPAARPPVAMPAPPPAVAAAPPPAVVATSPPATPAQAAPAPAPAPAPAVAAPAGAPPAAPGTAAPAPGRTPAEQFLLGLIAPQPPPPAPAPAPLTSAPPTPLPWEQDPTTAPRSPAEQFVLGLLAPRPATPVPERLPGTSARPVTPEVAPPPTQSNRPPAAPQPQPVALPRVPAPAGAIPFRCPPAGLRLTFNNGTHRLHHGTDPADPTVCRIGDQPNIERVLFGYTSLPVQDEQARRAGLARIWPAQVGARFSYTFFGVPGGGTTSMYRDTISVLRREILVVGGQQRDTIVIAFEQEGMAGNNFLGTTTFWWDIETGAWLKREVSITRGTSTARNYAATRIDFQ
jgi:hypothetical protein